MRWRVDTVIPTEVEESLCLLPHLSDGDDVTGSRCGVLRRPVANREIPPLRSE
jgi:hypothetical protein